MRFASVLLTGLLAATGCSSPPKPRGSASGTARPTADTNALIVMPSASVRGKIVVLNPVARYVIVSYPLGHIPQPERRMGVYRDGLKVGEIKMGAQRIDTNAVADITAGDCRVGDEVREE